jgi:hypothetical protein
MVPEYGALIAAGAVVFATHLLGAVTGFGSTMLALPALILLLGTASLNTVVAALLVMGCVQALQMVWYTWRSIDGRELGRIVLWTAAGMPVGALVLRHAAPGPVVMALGVVLVVNGALCLLPLRLATPGTWRAVGPAVLAAAGAVHGAFASGGMVLSVYAQHTLTDKERFRATLSIVWVLVNALLLAFMLLGGRIGAPALRLGAVGTLLAVPASMIGQRAASRVSQEHFARLVSALLIAGGIAAMARVMLID